jgi:alpha-galactosidase
VAVGDDVHVLSGGSLANQGAAEPGPLFVTGPAAAGTGLILFPRTDSLPATWVGPLPASTGPPSTGPAGLEPEDAAALLAAARPCPLLPQHGEGWFGRPGLSGHRLDTTGGYPAAGHDWSPLFLPTRSEHDGRRARVEATDKAAGLRLVTEIEAVPGGAIRARHTLTNLGRQPYVVDSLEVVFPVPGRVGEILDFTGRQTAERIPQRHQVGDGLWLREGRRGHTGHDSATVMAAGVPGFTFGSGEVYGLHVAWSGNTVHRVERVPSGLGMTAEDGGPGERLQPGVTTIGGGELLLPGEIALAEGESYATPWVYLAAARSGLDDLSAQFHGYLRSLPAHPRSPRLVNLNVWEAVYFRHDFGKLAALADAAAGLGVERFVLDDGWFRGRRSDQAGLGDWWVDEDVWPGGLHRLVEYVRGRGMQFGLWIEPEMVNPDSDLYRAHPDWILAAGHRVPPLQRHQLVLDLTRPEVAGYLLERISRLLAEYEISYVKWDCNRDIIDAGGGARGGAPAAHDQALAVYALLDELRIRHPDVEWESCAAGGGRVDLAILERVERVWTSDMTDALARQSIQRWTGQLVPPEYLGAHVSASFSHQTGRYMPMSLRGGTALFAHFGIEADITAASAEDVAELAAWIRLYKRHRALIHSGRVVRLDTPDDTAWMHGVVAPDQSAALMSYVQLDEPRNDQPVSLRVPGLDPRRRYQVSDVTPGMRRPRRSGLGEPGPPGVQVSGAALAEIGLAIAPQRTLTAAVILVEALLMVNPLLPEPTDRFHAVSFRLLALPKLGRACLRQLAPGRLRAARGLRTDPGTPAAPAALASPPDCGAPSPCRTSD